jgi:hypothetical protein
MAPRTGLAWLRWPEVPPALPTEHEFAAELRLRSYRVAVALQGLKATKRGRESACLTGWCRSGPMVTACDDAHRSQDSSPRSLQIPKTPAWVAES